MIYTVTFNPAIDYVLSVPKFKKGEINRSTEEIFYVGGKGINVSVVLKELGCTSVALGFVAGFTGEKIEQELKLQGITTDFVHLKDGTSRINVKIRSDEETDVNAAGPEIDVQSVEEFYKKIESLNDGDVLILAGSIPKQMSDDTYCKVLRILENKSINVVVDAEGDLLVKTLKYRPFLIKPNHIELSQMLGECFDTEEDIIDGAKRLQKAGAKNVLVSMAEKGAIFIDETGKSHRVLAPKGKLINSVGAGDSMVAGFIAGYMETKDYGYALKLGVAAGSATAFSVGLATAEEIEKILGCL